MTGDPAGVSSDTSDTVALAMTSPGSRWRAVAMPVVAAAIAAFLIAITAFTGIQRGMDHKVAFGPQSEQWAMTIALSESVYGLQLGYVGFKSVYDKLVEIWMRGTNGNPIDYTDPVQKQNASNGALINEALTSAASLGPQTPGFVSGGDLITMYYNDIGEVDFDRIAFRLFGVQVEAFYYLYFTILALSAAIFIVTFRENAFALAALLCVLLALYVELHLAMFPANIPTFPGMRHGSTLGFVPMLYFLFLLGRRISFPVLVAAVFELAVLILAWRIRGSVSWMLILIIAFYGSVGFVGWRRQPRGQRDWPALVRAIARWPAILLVFGIVANGVYNRAALHPVYFTDDVTAYHGLWHSAYLGLRYAPELMAPRAQALFAHEGATDTLAYRAAFDYAERVHFMPWSEKTFAPGYMSPWTHFLKARLNDNIVRGAFVEALVQHPTEALILYVYRKPLAIIRELAAAFPRDWTWIWLILIGGAGVFAFLIGFSRRTFDIRFVAGVSASGVAGLLGAALPNLWAYPERQTIIDLVLSVTALLPLALGTAVAVIAQILLWPPRAPPNPAKRR